MLPRFLGFVLVDVACMLIPKGGHALGTVLAALTALPLRVSVGIALLACPPWKVAVVVAFVSTRPLFHDRNDLTMFFGRRHDLVLLLQRVGEHRQIERERLLFNRLRGVELPHRLRQV